MISFQTVMVSDYVNTYAKHTYSDRAMNWSIVLDAGSQPYYPARKGFLSIAPDAGGATRHSDEYRYSFADVRSVNGESAVAALVERIEKIDAVVESSLAYNGDVRPGRLEFTVTNECRRRLFAV